MKTNKTQIQKNYFDALFFANATSTEKLTFHISPTEFKLLIKLVHYHNDQTNITWTSENISKHTSMSVGVIDKSIQRLKQKGYINTSTYNTDTYTKHRTIFINWEKIEEVNKLYLESIDNELQTKKEAPEPTITTEVIVDIQKEEIVSEIEEKAIQIDECEEENKYKIKWTNQRHIFDYSDLCCFDSRFKPENTGVNGYNFRVFVEANRLDRELIFEDFLKKCDNFIIENQKELAI